jgi:lysophospholipase L1-like esterase
MNGLGLAFLFCMGGMPYSDLTRALNVTNSQIEIAAGKYMLGEKLVTVKNTVQFAVPDVPLQSATEGMLLPNAPLNEGSWVGEGKLLKVRVSGITAAGSLLPGSLIITRLGIPLQDGVDYLSEQFWGRVVLGPSGVITNTDAVAVSYAYRMQRLDTVALDATGDLRYLAGTESLVNPQPPALPSGYVALFNVYRPYDSSSLSQNQIFLNEIDSTAVPTESTAGRIPKTLAKLQSGAPVKIVCWGDSVTVGADLSSQQERYSNLFENRVKAQFPQADITVTNISVGGTMSAWWLAAWDRGETNTYTFGWVLDEHPDLVTLEFVNDAGLTELQFKTLYDRISSGLSAIGAELILIAPHFTHPVLMGIDDLRTRESRPYVSFLKQYATTNAIALADASTRWANLYRSGLPYTTLLANGWNHPDRRGHEIFAEELMKCVCAVPTQGRLFTDDFTRANVAATNGSYIGSGYVITSTNGLGTAQFSITNNILTTGGTAPANGNHRVLSYQGFLAENTAGKSFTTSIDITLGLYSTGVNAGLAFNFQDEKNFYWARLVSSTASTATNGLLQFGQVVNGILSAFTAENISLLNVKTGTVYNLTISSSAAGAFSYALVGGTLNLSSNITDIVGGVDFTNGYVGIYAANNTGSPRFDNFSVTVQNK